MKFCIPHWNALRKAIESRGLSHLVAKTGEDAAKRLTAEVKGTATDRTFDPLMSAHNMIVGRAIEMGGIYLLTGEYCPICEAVKHKPEDVTVEVVEAHWIDGPADGVLEYCREKKLVLAQ